VSSKPRLRTYDKYLLNSSVKRVSDSSPGASHSLLTREALAEILDGGRLLLLANLLVFLLVGSSLQTLPRQTAAEEVHEDVAQSLEIISTTLFAAQMGVDGHVTGGSAERLALTVGNVLLRLWVTVLLGHAEVDDVNNVGSLGARATDEEVVGLDVAVDEVLLVDGLHARQHLLGDHDDSLGGEATVAVVEQVFEGRAQQIDDKNVV
jgi:hypothetical protein